MMMIDQMKTAILEVVKWYFIFCSSYLSPRCSVFKLGVADCRKKVLVQWGNLCHPYLESTIVLSDNKFITSNFMNGLNSYLLIIVLL